jgi:rhamnogalacturonyl hydrolase YesR
MNQSLNTLPEEAFAPLHAYLKRNQYKGWEFDDMLSSPLLNGLTFGNLFLKRCVVQVGKLSPLNLRPLLGVPKQESAKARGFFAKGYLAMFQATGDEEWLDCAEEQLDWLAAHTLTQHGGVGWGNDFDFASRGGFFPKGLPTVVWTGLISEVLVSAIELTGKEQYKRLLQGACEFVEHGLGRIHTDASGFCFAYAPGLLNHIHNSNLFGASVLLRGASVLGESRYLELAKQSVEWTLADELPQHGFMYGAEEKYQWIDNFHSAYVLDALHLVRQTTGDDWVSKERFDACYAYWRDTFFLEDGTPRYYENSTYPLDIQCAAQAIETFAKLASHQPDALEMAEKVATWTLANMQKPNGAFRYRIEKHYKIDLENIHWGQSTMLAALGLLLRARAEFGHSREGGNLPQPDPRLRGDDGEDLGDRVREGRNSEGVKS